MDAIELFLPDGKPAKVWACGKCLRLHNHQGQPVGDGKGHQYTPDERDEFGRLAAVRCCDFRCKVCNEKCREFYTLCDKHEREDSALRERENEAKRFEKAEKLTPDEWGQSDASHSELYDALCDKWFRDLDDADEWYADDEERERPAYLWLSEEIGWEPDPEGDIRDQMHNEFHEDADDCIPKTEWKKLTDFVSEWWKENRVLSYQPDFSRCVLLPELTKE